MPSPSELDSLLDHPWILRTYAPVYVMRFPAEPDDATLDAFCAARERWAQRARFSCAWVCDMSQLRTMPSAKQRRMFAEHLGRFEPHDVAWNHGSAIVAPNAVIKGALTAVFWMAPPKFPNQAFGSFDDALAWAKAQLAAPMSERAAG
ncbi:MAG: hypothetical protein R3B40_19115 [Polyangiales bacterium]|nr:hypothetical protein [Myxococcales bacterium]MCB9657834.1 hypothetical protein [Sandaracinaceae bacterium]